MGIKCVCYQNGLFGGSLTISALSTQMKLARSAYFLLASSTVALAANVQAPVLILPPSAAQHKAAVVDIFNRSFSAYK
jgi:hypothetical protein